MAAEPEQHATAPAEHGAPSEIVYVSWGGTGRAATVRQAIERASDSGRGLVYLAILDDSTFGDIDEPLLDLARDELSWLLDAQLELTKSQTRAGDVPVRVLVRAGDVADEVVKVVTAVGQAEVLVGAPVPVAGDESVTDLVELLARRVGVPVSVIEPA